MDFARYRIFLVVFTCSLIAYGQAKKELRLYTKETGLVVKIMFDDILFDTNKSEIREDSKGTLDRIAKYLKKSQEVPIQVRGHTDINGSNVYNRRLSLKRALSVKKYLVDAGIDPDRVLTKGYGETEPLVNCLPCSEEQHQENRRVEFILIDKKDFLVH